MAFEHIHSHDRFHQKADFSQVSIWGTDIDYMAEINNRFFILCDWKVRHTGMPNGQRLAFSRMVNAIGLSKPCMFLVAEHNTDPLEPLHGNNSFVTSVMYRFPDMRKWDEYIYEGKCPTLNEWLSDLSFYFNLRKKLTALPTDWEELPNITEAEWDDHYRPMLEARRKANPGCDGLIGGVDVPVNTGFFTHIRPLFDD